MSTATSTRLPVGVWTVDPAHSQVGFSVRHCGIATVRGEFTRFEGTLSVAEDVAASTVDASIEAASVSTGMEDRDAHMRADDFLKAEAYPTITFRASSLTPAGDDAFTVDGALSMAGVTLPVRLDAHVLGTDSDPYGNERVGLELTGAISRKAFGMEFNAVLGSGNLVLSDEVKVRIDVSAIRQEA